MQYSDSAIKALAQVEYFIYRPTVLSRSAHDFRPSSTLMKLSEIPRLTSDGRKIFPRLIKARLTFNAASHFPLHVVRQQLAEVSSRIPRHISTCFLADIKILFLDKIMSNRSGDLYPALELLVIRNLTTVTITFALERDLLPSKDAAYFLIGQKALETVIIDIEEYLKYHEVTPTAKGKIKRMEEHAEPVRFALNDFSWWQNKYWKHFRELILVLDENQSQRFILSLRKVIVKDWWTDTWEKEWLRKNLKWTSRNSTRQPVRLFPFRNVRLYRDIPSV